MKDLPGYPTDRMKIEYLLAAVEKLQAEVAASPLARSMENSMNGYDELMLEMLFALLAVPVDGTHKHRCEECGVVWEHPNTRAGEEDAHCCPECGELLSGGWYHYEGDSPPDYVEGPDGYPLAA